jgi:hypothetical protein
MTDINVVLQRAHNAVVYNKDHLGVNIAELFGEELPEYARDPPCFFLKRELEHTKESARTLGFYRHCKVYRGHYLDYTTRTEHASLEEWAAKCGSTINEIMFGWNRFDGRPTHIPLKKLLDYLSPPLDIEIEELTLFANKLRVDDLGLNDLLVDTRTGIIKTYTVYMEE